jgi:hypothetical protein
MHGGDTSGGSTGSVLTAQPDHRADDFARHRGAIDRDLLGIGAAAGLAAGGLVLAGRVLDIIDGWPAAVLLAAALLSIPVARSLSVRILVMGSLLFGWMPMLWWVPWPSWLARSDLLLAGVVGLAAASAIVCGVRAGAAAFLPSFDRVDALPLVGGAVAVVASWDKVSARTPLDALTSLLPGWDNAPHLHFILTMRSVDAAGEYWHFQAFDAYIAMLMELVARTPGPAMGSDLVLAAQAQGWAAVIGAMMVVAAVSATARAAGAWAMSTACAVVCALFVLGSGGILLEQGYQNFWTVNVGVTALVGLALVARNSGITPALTAAGAAVCVGAANGWPPMLALATPAALVICALALRQLRRSSWPARSAYFLAFTLGIVGVFRAFYVLRGAVADPSSYVDPIPHAGFPTSNVFVTVTVVLAGIALLSLYLAPGPVKRYAWLGYIPLSGTLAAVGLAAIQLKQGGTLTYYFFKLLLGVQMISLAVICLALVGLAELLRVRRRWLTRALRLSAIVIVIAFVGSSTGWGQGPYTREPETLLQMRKADRYLEEGWSAAEIASAAALNPDGSTSIGYLAFAEEEISIRSAENWFRALTGSWEPEAFRRVFGVLAGDEVPRVPSTPTERLMTLETVLDHDPTTVVIVPPRVYDELIAGLDNDEMRSRVITWDE